ncbi:MAG TPA: hypothetical protein VMW27_08530 [Thermoanaerobaculia bacterium]|nr:hypothetical protein [Thermoanaerobaculia bacterium]
MFFTPPYPSLFSPAPSILGSPVVSEGMNVAVGRFLITLATDPAGPSRVHLLRSWGMWAGVPRDAREQPYLGRSVLQVNATFSFMGSFVTRGLFGMPFDAVWVKIFIEEFDAGFNFRRAFEGPPRDILRVSPTYISGADSFPRSGRTSASLNIVAEPRMNYRVFVDVEAELRGAGFAGFGGSGATASVGVDVEGVGASFYIDPGIF